jgi:hypothetical protein
LGELSLASGALDAAEEYGYAAYAIAAGAQQMLAIGRGERLLGRIAAARADWDGAQRHLAESEHIFQTCGAGIELGITLLARAVTERGVEVDQRRGWLLKARRLFRRARALPLLKQAEQRLCELDHE